MGRPAKPINVLRLEGGYRADRHAGRGPAQGGEPLQKPDGLGEHGSWLWDEVARTRRAWLCASDAAALRALCDAYQLMRRCEPALRDDPTDKNARCAWSAYHAVFRQLGAAFGLTPSDRARLGENKSDCDQDRELESLLR